MGQARLKWLWISLGVVAVVCVGTIVFVLLPMFGVGGNQTEHGLVAYDVRPDGKQIVFSSSSGDLFTLDLQSRSVHHLTQSKAFETDPCYSPDAQTIVFSAVNGSNGASLFSMPSSGGSIHPLTTGQAVSDSSPHFSSDGKSLVFIRAARYRPYSMGGMVWDDYDVYTLDLASDQPHQLTREKYYSAGPAVLVDADSHVVYAAETHGEGLASRLFSVSVDGKSPPSPFDPPPQGAEGFGAWASDVSYSRDGRKMTYISDRAKPFEYDVYVADSSGSNARALGFTSVSRYNQSPKFAPDGGSVYVLAGLESNSHSRPIFSLYQVDLDGHASRIAGSELFTHPEKWKGD